MEIMKEVEKELIHTKKAINRVLDGLKTFGKHLGNIILFAIAIIAGFCIGYYYSVLLDKTAHASPMKSVKSVATTSIAISERNELLIIDRASGNYTVFQDSVGLAIFNTYANRLYNQATVKTSKPAVETNSNEQ